MRRPVRILSFCVLAALVVAPVPALAVPSGTPNAGGIGALSIANALAELTASGSQAAARANLGLLGMALQDPAAVAITGGAANLTGGLSSENLSTANTLKSAAVNLYGRDTVNTRKMTGAVASVGEDANDVGAALAFQTRANDTLREVARITSGGDLVIEFGGVSIPKLSAAPSAAPGAGVAKLFAVAGTNSGTCKVQVIAGTSTTPVTLVDNVGTGC